MTDYSKTFLDHYRRPRNVGDLEKADAVAIVHENVCGDVMRLAIVVERPAVGCRVPPRVAAAAFKAYGCAAAIAVGSMLTEMVAGRRVDSLERVTDTDIAEALGGLPAARIHAAVLGRAALRAALSRLA